MSPGAQTVEYEHNLGPGSIVRARFEKEAGRIHSFVYQLECLLNDKWHIIVRYDTAHGFAHRDILHPAKEATKESVDISDFNEALTYAQSDIGQNWQHYRERYARWLKSK